MKTASFENTVNILVKAYLNDKLRFMDCAACAVGNIISGSGYTLTSHDVGLNGWFRYLRDRNNCCERLAEEQIAITGYTPQQLSNIEHAFETTPYSYGDRMFNGLMNVIDVLAIIHNVDLSVKESAKQLFVKA